MSIKFTLIGTILLTTAAVSLVPTKAVAEPEVDAVFKKAYFENSGDAYTNDNWERQLNVILGFQGFPEQQIAADGKLLDIIYRDVLEQQVNGSALLKTRDLNNPFNTSLGENPNYSAN